MTTDFCTEALEEAITKYGRPEIFNTDQGSQFTSEEFTGILKANNIAISMDGKGRWMDNVFIERLWRSVKYEHVYLHSYDSIADLRQGLKTYFNFFNLRAHQSVTFHADTARCLLCRQAEESSLNTTDNDPSIIFHMNLSHRIGPPQYP